MAQRMAVFVALFASAVGLIIGNLGKEPTVEDRNAAIAEVIRYEIEQFVGAEVYRTSANTEKASICLAGDIPLGFNTIASELVDTIIHIVPIDDCTSETVEGNFGMFSAMTYYFNPSGQQAGHIKITNATCSSARRCTVEIDMTSFGSTYLVEKRAGGWEVTRELQNWIV